MTAPRILYVVNDPAFFLSHRVGLARAAQQDINAAISLASAPVRKKENSGKIANLDVTYHTLPMQRISKNPVTIAKSCHALIKLMNNTKPDIIHAVALKAIVLCAVAGIFARKPRIILMFTGMGLLFAKRSILYRMAQICLLIALRFCCVLGRGRHQIITQNTNDARLLKRWGIAHETSIHVVPGSGVDMNTITPTPVPNTQPPIILLATRLLRSKGIKEFAESARLLKEKGIKARFILAGDIRTDSPDGVPEQQIRAWHDGGLIEWIGFCDNVGTWIDQAQIIAYPSWYREGIPRFLIESCGHARPIITTNHPGCRDAVIDGKTGTLVPVQDAPALAAAIETLLNDHALCIQMGKKGRKLAEATFDMAIINQQIIDIYKNLLSRAA